MDEAKETRETKGELSREDVHDILQGMQRPTRGWPAVGDFTAERVARRTPPAGNARKAIPGGLASVGDSEVLCWQPSTASALPAWRSFDKAGKTDGNGTVQRPAVKLVGQLGKTRNDI